MIKKEKKEKSRKKVEYAIAILDQAGKGRKLMEWVNMRTGKGSQEEWRNERKGKHEKKKIVKRKYTE